MMYKGTAHVSLLCHYLEYVNAQHLSALWQHLPWDYVYRNCGSLRAMSCSLLTIKLLKLINILVINPTSPYVLW